VKKHLIGAAETYLKHVNKVLVTGTATEHTFRPALKTFIEQLKTGIVATNEPKRISCGAPDFIVTSGQIPLGYVEAKDIGESLDKAEKSEQMHRYLPSLANLILTDYIEFRWYVSGVYRLSAKLGKVSSNGSVKASSGGFAEVTQLLEAFLAESAPIVSEPRELATRMAAIARLIRDTIQVAITTESDTGALHEQMKGFREVLLHDLSPESFADMYAQTIAYGLFAARANAAPAETFTREHAAYELPRTNPFLRRMFNHIAGPELDESIAWAVDDIAELLNRADMTAILAHFGNRVRQEDPVVHFYETFLSAYDPEMREMRGVYYTPEPVVSYIVRSVDKLLKSQFKLSEGLADSSTIQVKNPAGKGQIKVHKVIVLDPATGTGTFLHSVVDQIYDAVGVRNPGLWSSYVSRHLLPRLFGFELLMAPYAVAHMKLGLQLAESGYDFQAAERLGVFLTNTLEEAHEMTHLPLFTQWLAAEATAANEVKKGKPVMVIVGNPPYSGHSANRGKWIVNLLKGKDTQTGSKTGSYFEVDGESLDEVQVKWLHDDYVKFIRFAQWRIEMTGYGILAFITNNGFLDNPTFRGMRNSLLETFDDIFVLDLHGSTKKREVAADGTPDDNVFDIQQGVAISMFVRRGAGSKAATVWHADLRGARELFDVANGKLVGGKYHWLASHDVESTEWTRLSPQKPRLLFVPQDAAGAKEYEEGWLLTDLMPDRTVGIVTARDGLTIHFTPDEVLETVREFARLDPADAASRFGVKDGGEWKVTSAQSDLNSQPISQDRVVPVLYRPFDVRYTYYTGKSHGFIIRPQRRIMRHMLFGDNIALSTTRGTEAAGGWEHVLCSSHAIQHHTVSIKEVNYLFPLYLLPEETGDVNGQVGFHDMLQSRERRTNLDPEFIKSLEKATGATYDERIQKSNSSKTFGAEDVLAYAYATLNSEGYRERFAAFLRRDFPRVPIVASLTLFRDLVRRGHELIDLHLMRAEIKAKSKFPIKGNGLVERVFFREPQTSGKHGEIWINETQYFSEISASTWSYSIGGYRICEKWMLDRKGRELSYDELSHYLYILQACERSAALVVEIDNMIDAAGGWLAVLKK
jgi:predicted helicase